MWASTAGTDAHGSAYCAVRLELIQADSENIIFMFFLMILDNCRKWK
jgi:hypothetical protein